MTARSVEANDLPVKALLSKDRYESFCFCGNIFVIASPMSPTKITRLVFCDWSVYVIFHRVLVQCRTNLTWQFVVIKIKPSKCCQLSNFCRDRSYNNNKISILWLVGQWNFPYIFSTNDLPVRELPQSDKALNAVNCPISAGIAPTKITRLVCCDMSVYGYISTKITHLKKITKMKNGTSHPTYENKNWQKSFWQYCTIRKSNCTVWEPYKKCDNAEKRLTA